MRRILTLSFALCAILCLFVFSSAAAEIDDPMHGYLYDKVIYWGDYVTSSIPGEEVGGQMPGWVTSINLPKDSLYEIRNSNGDFIDSTYSTNGELTYRFSSVGDYVVDWYTPYYIDIEDLRYGDDQLIYLAFYSNNDFSFYDLQVHFYDYYLNPLESFSITFSENNRDSVAINAQFYIPERIIRSGAKYIKFNFRINESVANIYDGYTMRHFDWTVSLPYEFDPSIYKKDGLDAWMNSYFPSISPDVDDWWVAEDDLLSFVADSLETFKTYVDSVVAAWTNLNIPFSIWKQIFNTFLGLSFVRPFIFTSCIVGILGFLLGQTRDMSGKKERQKERMSRSERSNLRDKEM